VAAPAAHAGRVHEDEGRVAAAKDGVDRVARRSRLVGDDHALLAHDRVDEARLADVRAPEHRHADRVPVDLRRPLAGQALDDEVQEVARPVPVQGRDRERIAETQTVELDRLVVAARVVDLVGHDEHRLARPSEDVGHLLVAGRDSRLRVDDEDDEIGLLHRAARLLRDLLGQRRVVSDVDPARVHEDEALAGPLADDILAIACHAGRLEDHGLPGRGQAVDEGRLADVGEADDGDGPQERRVGHVAREGTFSRRGGVASRGSPSSCIRPSHSHSRRISASISRVAV
jgi:hypothetical protein